MECDAVLQRRIPWNVTLFFCRTSRGMLHSVAAAHSLERDILLLRRNPDDLSFQHHRRDGLTSRTVWMWTVTSVDSDICGQ